MIVQTPVFYSRIHSSIVVSEPVWATSDFDDAALLNCCSAWGASWPTLVGDIFSSPLESEHRSQLTPDHHRPSSGRRMEPHLWKG
ncbi:hypothetical protein MPTK1_8g04170 [Marchantia polymorpha subsp. ruderalis]|uniref:Uncharacterized protein n=1 Tax=Marchantia polymorpha TaxID=3197 RepID=A0A2R6XJI0_MARPO|nr:hypothetical protein MARPO_0012s0206 [Marchantia polymorpha]BBN18640.1 hypothetical protein Mp_8g04170 [Marchantia polymorpha subsp. ruderalis]|eukprot:PTQ46287.1 hypothetical protein MARPO_0012s0206 [Marchantia polymorpha]